MGVQGSLRGHLVLGCPSKASAPWGYWEAGSRLRAWPAEPVPAPAALFCDYYNPEGQCEWHYQPCGAPCLRTCRNPRGQCLHDTRGLEGGLLSCWPGRGCPGDPGTLGQARLFLTSSGAFVGTTSCSPWHCGRGPGVGMVPRPWVSGGWAVCLSGTQASLARRLLPQVPARGPHLRRGPDAVCGHMPTPDPATTLPSPGQDLPARGGGALR